MPKVKDGASKKKVRTSVSLAPDDYAEIERIAEQNRVSISWVVREAVEEYLDKRGPLFRRK